MGEMKQLTIVEVEELLQTLEQRFEKNKQRHPNTSWSEVKDQLVAKPEKLVSLFEMERTEGEPDVVELEEGVLTFVDCAVESPKGRRSVCYDREALESRKQHKPVNSAIDLANEFGAQLLTEQQYRQLQTYDEFDKKTSSWIETPQEIRSLGGALFCDRRYNTIFLYHNGAESYYAARGFRAVLYI